MYVQRLHALDLGSGNEKFGGPVVIQGQVPGTGSGAAGGVVAFVPLRQNQRPGLLLSRGVVYVGFGSHGDHQPYHGWVFGYDANTLDRTLIWNVTPNAEGGGIWQGGGALAADAGGSIYFVTGDGTFTQNVGGVDFGDSFVKLSPGGAVLDFFTPHDEATLDAADTDLGSGGTLLIPDQGDGRPPLMIEAGKNGRVYLVNRNDMGKFRTNTDAVVQTLPVSSKNLSSPVYYKGSIYLCNVVAPIQEFKLSQGLLGAASQTADVYNYPGAAMAISASGGNNGILWAIQSSCPSDTSEACTGTTAQGVLRAYDAENLTVRLYSSDEKSSGTRSTSPRSSASRRSPTGRCSWEATAAHRVRPPAVARAAPRVLDAAWV